MLASVGSGLDLKEPKVADVQPLSFRSPVKFAGGDWWSRGPVLASSSSLLSVGSSAEQPMDVSAVEHMDTSGGGTSEASAPLPIRSGGLFKKQVYPMNSKRPEHLRMNL